MGMFDTVRLTCPNCDKVLEIQTKAGECLGYSYSESSVPLVIVYSLDGKYVHCENCQWAGNVVRYVRQTNCLKLETVN